EPAAEGANQHLNGGLGRVKAVGPLPQVLGYFCTHRLAFLSFRLPLVAEFEVSPARTLHRSCRAGAVFPVPARSGRAPGLLLRADHGGRTVTFVADCHGGPHSATRSIGSSTDHDPGARPE